MASYQIAYILERQKLYRFQYLSTYGRSAYMQKLNTVENQSQREQQPKNGRRDQYIGTFQELPEFLKDNENITDGYRINFNTPRQIMRSLFMIHNETVNIWTHCITGLAIISFLLYCFVIIHQQNKAIQSYQDTMGTGINYYMNALDNLQTISDHERQKSEAKMKEVKEEANNNFQQFINLMQQSKNNIENSIQSQFNQIKSNIKQILRNNLVQFQKIKIQFQNKIAPMFVKEMDESFNRNQWLKQIKKYVIKLKERLDSEDFEHFELNIKKDNPQSISRWPIFVFLASALFCLTASTIFHLFYPMNLKVYTVTHRCDYAGISILICGSVFPPFYYGLYCTVNVAIFYLTISILLAIFTFLVCLFQWIHKPEHKVYKSLLFTGYGLTYIFPVSHIFINEFIYDNYGDPFQFMSSFVYIFLLGTSYYVGLYIYTIRCPERSNPGKYNICGHSHQIWHGFSIMGMIFTYLMAIESFEMRKMSQCPA